VTRPIRPWLGETPQELAVWALVSLLAGASGGLGYGAATGHALRWERARDAVAGPAAPS
jgi:hypothetical protein